MVNYRIRENIFNKVMVLIRKILYVILQLDKHIKIKPFLTKDKFIPLLSYNLDEKCYQFNCYCLESVELNLKRLIFLLMSFMNSMVIILYVIIAGNKNDSD